MVSRREFTFGSATTVASLLLPKRTLAQVKIGEGALTTVSDGNLLLPGDFGFEHLDPATLESIYAEVGMSAGQLMPECNLALYQDGQNTVLFDVGSGPDFMPSSGVIAESLNEIGVSPDDITHVVITHAHPDHIWGLLDDFDDPLFLNASYLMGRAEWDFWWDSKTVDRVGEARAAFAVGAKRRMEVIADAVSFFEDGEEILPGIEAISTTGHTPGHMSFEVRRGADAALVLGDAIANHHLALRKPDWESGSDQEPALAAKTRRMLLDRIVSEKIQVIGFHLPNGGIGHVDTLGDAFHFISES